MSHISNIDLTECEPLAACSHAVDEFPVAMRMLAEQHRPSRMPFFRNLAALDHAAACDPSFLKEDGSRGQRAREALDEWEAASGKPGGQIRACIALSDLSTTFRLCSTKVRAWCPADIQTCCICVQAHSVRPEALRPNLVRTRAR